MALKKCKDCGVEISKSAKTCPQCGKSQRMPVWLRAIIIIFLLMVMVAAASGGSNTTNTSNTNTSSSTSVVTKENYDKIEKGMTKEQVKTILGDPTSISENEIPGVGTTELNHYQEPLTFIAIDIYFQNGKVYMKNYTQL